MNISDLKLEVVHLGINPTDGAAHETAALFASMLGTDIRELKDSYFPNERIEVMKSVSWGTNGHIGIGTVDPEKAIQYFESLGLTFDHSSATYNDDHSIRRIYMND